jgi:hypothetical protein
VKKRRSLEWFLSNFASDFRCWCDTGFGVYHGELTLNGTIHVYAEYSLTDLVDDLNDCIP